VLSFQITSVEIQNIQRLKGDHFKKLLSRIKTSFEGVRVNKGAAKSEKAHWKKGFY